MGSTGHPSCPRFTCILNVLVLAGIESIFFTAAGMGLCFGFVLATVLTIEGRFRYC